MNVSTLCVCVEMIFQRRQSSVKARIPLRIIAWRSSVPKSSSNRVGWTMECSIQLTSLISPAEVKPVPPPSAKVSYTVVPARKLVATFTPLEPIADSRPKRQDWKKHSLTAKIALDDLSDILQVKNHASAIYVGTGQEDLRWPRKRQAGRDLRIHC